MMPLLQRPGLIPWEALELGWPFRIALTSGKDLDPCVPQPFPPSNEVMRETNIKCGTGVREMKYLNCSKSWWDRGNPSVRRNKTQPICHLWNPFLGPVTSAARQPCILATVSGPYAWFASFPSGVKTSLLPVSLFFVCVFCFSFCY